MLSEISHSSKLLDGTSRPVLLRYGFAILVVLLALLIRWPLQPLLGLSAPFLFFFPAVMAAAWYGRMGPGLLATALSMLASGVFLLEPVGSLSIAGFSAQLQLVLFGSTGIFICLLNEALHRERHRVEEVAAKLIQAKTEAQESEERFRITARSAEEANRAKDDFLAVVSHELRTPLNAMMGWAQILLAADADPERRQKGLATIVRNGRLQAQLIDDLLDVSRIITGKMRLDVRPIELVPVIEAAIESIRPGAEAKQISLQRILDPLAGPIAGDPSRLQQVVWNLLANAVKFTPKGGRIEVRLERANSHVEILVADTGIGIGPAFLPHVFDRFRQLDGSIKRQHGGLGLGLAIVRHLAELHGGTVRAKSPGEGQGSTFIVRLPVSVARLERAEGEEERVHPGANDADETCKDNPALNLKGIRVLVVEDEPDARETLRHILEHCDAEVWTVASAAEGMTELARFKPHVLLSDIGLPGEDGYSLIRRIRSLPPEEGGKIPAAALTAFARGEDRRRALRAGFQMHLAKPVDIHELAAVVATLARG